MTAEIAHEAEEERRHHGFSTEAPKVSPCVGNNVRILCEYGSGEIATEPDQQEDADTDGKGKNHAESHGFSGTVLPVSADILRDKGTHGLHQRRRHKHDKGDELACHAVSGRSREAEPVDKSAQEHKRDLCQKLLQGERRADADDPQGFPVKSDVFTSHMERQIFPAHDDNRQNNADCLCRHRCDRCAGYVHVKYSDEKQITEDVDDTRNTDEQQRCFGIAESAEDSGDDIVGDDKKYTGAADSYIGCRQINSLSGGLHENGDGARKNDHDKAENGTDHRKQADGGADKWPDFLSFFFHPDNGR